MTKIIGLIDLDFAKYTVASIGEERYVEVTHTPTEQVKEFPNQTEFHGRNKKSGWLGDKNAELLKLGLETFPLEDFEIVQKQRKTAPIENVLNTAKKLVDGAMKGSGATIFEGYMGKGDPFRLEWSTLMKYKGNRDNTLRPLWLPEVTEYLEKKYDATTVTGIEADDKLVMRCHELLEEGEDAFIIGEDKDYYGSPVRFFNVNKPEEGVMDCRGFGKLWLDEKGKVRGKGRLFKYLQICSGDSSDNYKANAHSSIKWAEKGAYKVLKPCKDDKQAWQCLVDTFKRLYPSPKTITTWKGDEVEIDWLYCLQECTDMAHMRRWKDDRIIVKDELNKLGVSYE